ncbi:MAG: hypothetical protein QOE03_2908, partial [Micromonosporaceae bacterium]|nr:hypothetical protein [Micromonosporaceae bacterium]
LETVLKSLLLTRTLCSSLSLGAGAHALELGLDFAGDRHLYGRSLLELPRARAVLADVCAEYLLVQALSLVGVRSIHTLTGEMSLTSAAIKYLAPTRTDRLISNVGQVLGARALLVDGHACGQFEKLARDHRIVGIFDGNTHVNLHAIVNELPTVARRAGRKPDADALTELFDLHRPVPAFDPQRLSLLSRTGSSVFAALPELVRWLQSLGRHRPELAEATALAERLRQHQDSFVTGLAGHRPARVVPAAAFRAAENFTWYLAGSAALGLWLGNHERHDTAPLWREGLWLRAVLRRVLTALGQPPPRSLTDDDTVLATVLDGHRYAAALSLLTSSPTQRGTR